AQAGQIQAGQIQQGQAQALTASGLTNVDNGDSAANVNADGFAHTAHLIMATLQARNLRDVVLVGYSLGARVAMSLACQLAQREAEPSLDQERDSSSPCLVGMVLEGGHFGLPDDERAARYANDCRWANRFVQEPMALVLSDWYQQPVFASLTAEQRQRLVQKRSDNQGSAVAHMLLATSLAKQPFLLPQLTECPHSVHYLCGEKDTKFTALAARSGLAVTVIADAGHNVHVEQPLAFARAVQDYLEHIL
ncbi:hypothetical protein C9I90_21160, partial [Photobacterium aphoticum]